MNAAHGFERDIARLLEKILLAANTITHADGGTLYRVGEDRQSLRFEIVHNDTLGIALGGTSGNPIDFPDLPLQDVQGIFEALTAHDRPYKAGGMKLSEALSIMHRFAGNGLSTRTCLPYSCSRASSGVTPKHSSTRNRSIRNEFDESQRWQDGTSQPTDEKRHIVSLPAFVEGNIRPFSGRNLD